MDPRRRGRPTPHRLRILVVLIVRRIPNEDQTEEIIETAATLQDGTTQARPSFGSARFRDLNQKWPKNLGP